MSIEFFGRLQKELSITGSAVYESVVAIAERVNRKVHILRLHGQAANLLTQIEKVQGNLGQHIAESLPNRWSESPERPLSTTDLDRPLNQATDQIHRLKQTLLQVDSQIRSLKSETIHEDFLTLQRDLGMRGAAIERIVVSRGAGAIGKTVSSLSLPPSVRLVTIFRGPFLIAPSEDLVFHPDDIVIAVGLRSELEQVTEWFRTSRAAKSA
ncbi:TrkA C-terminal domain-containing protein [Petrachloros mirabilis]